MNKREKTALFLTIIMFVMIITSSIYTIFKLKPDGYKFNIERIFEK